jgi:sulfite reductase alpha subunit-like flavoprotein
MLPSARLNGYLTCLDTAISRDQEDKVYVRNKMPEQATLFWS